MPDLLNRQTVADLLRRTAARLPNKAAIRGGDSVGMPGYRRRIASACGRD